MTPLRNRILGGLDRLLSILAALILLTMMGVTLFDVLGRSLLNQPVPGAFELTELLLLAVIFAGLPQACRTSSHISVTVISEHFPARLNAGLARVFALIGAVALAAIAWSMANLGLEKIEYRDVTSFLGIPIGPVALLVSALIALSALAEAARAFFPAIASYGDHGTDIEV